MSLAAAPSISAAAYQGISAGHGTLAQVIQAFGNPLSRGALQSLLGGGWLQTLLGGQPAGLSCAYYLNGAARTTQAFQLCFATSGTLVEKAIISTA